jgi:hypothetical protein
VTNLMKIPNSWADRKAVELIVAVEPEEDKFVYMGCCMNMEGATVQSMVDSDKWENKNTEENRALELKEIKEKCSNVMAWARTMGYVENPEEGLTLENDWSLSYGKGDINGVWCYWIDHSRIEYVWVDPSGVDELICDISDPQFYDVSAPQRLNMTGTQTGRISSKNQNLANAPKSLEDFPPDLLTPAERAGIRARRRKKDQ